MINHLVKSHKKLGKNSSMFRGYQNLISGREGAWNVTHLVMEKENFFFEVYKKNFLFYFWVFILGPQEKASDYLYTIKISNKDNVSYWFLKKKDKHL